MRVRAYIFVCVWGGVSCEADIVYDSRPCPFSFEFRRPLMCGLVHRNLCTNWPQHAGSCVQARWHNIWTLCRSRAPAHCAQNRTLAIRANFFILFVCVHSALKRRHIFSSFAPDLTRLYARTSTITKTTNFSPNQFLSN